MSDYWTNFCIGLVLGFLTALAIHLLTPALGTVLAFLVVLAAVYVGSYVLGLIQAR